MEQISSSSSIPRLISLLESLASSTHQTVIGVESNCKEAQSLLYGWTLPGSEVQSETLSACLCSEIQKRQLQSLLEKVDKAVKYSQCVREGRNDVENPWQDEKDIVPPKKDPPKKVVSRTGLKPAVPPRKSGVGLSREKQLSKCDVQLKRNGNGLLESSFKKDVGKLSGESGFHCPVHSNVNAELSQVESKPPSVGLAEALDVMGIPPELVVILKSVNHYINRLRSTNMKNRTEAAFLRHLNQANSVGWEDISYREECPGFSTNVSSLSNCELMSRMKISDVSQDSELCMEPCLKSQGVWNPQALENILAKALCVQYRDVQLWQMLQSRLQHIQLCHAELQILDILCSDPVFSNLNSTILSCASSYLKAAAALSRLSFLTLPALVKTSDSPHCHRFP